ncbi:MAG: MBL fold metallo-hydrolase [Chloroflexi bacterium]|nr:MBL fold metallo-hydrolase [Chloroflexota bacterium]
MVQIAQLVPDIYNIEHSGGHASRCSVYLIAGETGLLFDTGPSSQVPGILEALRSIDYNPERIAYIVASHLHADHAGGAGFLAQQLPQARVVAHEQGAHHLAEPSRLIAGSRQAYGEIFDTEFGPIVPVAREQLMVVKGGERLDLGDRAVELLYTPGHSLNSLCLYDPASRGLFCGDSVGNHLGGKVIIPQAFPTQFDLETALETIDRLESLGPNILCPAHFGPVRDVALMFRTARESLLTWRDVALKALKAGEPDEAIVARFRSLVGEATHYEPAALRTLLELVVEGYRLYFRRKGLL